MLIDWFTVGAQIVNFLILVWVLKRFLYRPILEALAAREKAILDRETAATAAQKEAQEIREKIERQTSDIEEQHRLALQAMDEAVQAERARLLQQVNQEAGQLRATRMKELETEIERSRSELLTLTRREIVALTRRILFDLSSSSLEEASVEVFLRRIEAITPRAEPPLPGIPDAERAIARMRSPFALSSRQQQSIQHETERKFRITTPLTFETTPELGLGFELTVRDEKIAWGIDSHLASFEKRLAELTVEGISEP